LTALITAVPVITLITAVPVITLERVEAGVDVEDGWANGELASTQRSL
jgi:hypothetical protein